MALSPVANIKLPEPMQKRSLFLEWVAPASLPIDLDF